MVLKVTLLTDLEWHGQQLFEVYTKSHTCFKNTVIELCCFASIFFMKYN